MTGLHLLPVSLLASLFLLLCLSLSLLHTSFYVSLICSPPLPLTMIVSESCYENKHLLWLHDSKRTAPWCVSLYGSLPTTSSTPFTQQCLKEVLIHLVFVLSVPVPQDKHALCRQERTKEHMKMSQKATKSKNFCRGCFWSRCFITISLTWYSVEHSSDICVVKESRTKMQMFSPFNAQISLNHYYLLLYALVTCDQYHLLPLSRL